MAAPVLGADRCHADSSGPLDCSIACLPSPKAIGPPGGPVLASRYPSRILPPLSQILVGSRLWLHARVTNPQTCPRHFLPPFCNGLTLRVSVSQSLPQSLQSFINLTCQHHHSFQVTPSCSMAPSLNNDRMFEFNGTAADSREGREPNGRVADHCNMQQLGRRPYTTMVHHQRALTEDVKRPSLVDIRSRSNTSTSSSPLEVTNTKQITSFDRSNPANSTDRRSSSGSTHTRGDSSSSLGKALLSKGSRFLRRQNSKQDQDLTSLRTLDWLEESERGRGDHVQETPHRRNPRHSRIRSDGEFVGRFVVALELTWYTRCCSQVEHIRAFQLSSLDPHDASPCPKIGRRKYQRPRVGVFCNSCITATSTGIARHKS